MIKNLRLTTIRTAIEYAIGILSPIIGCLIYMTLTRYFELDLPTFLTFYPTVMFVALLIGFWPATVAIVVAVLLTDYWILNPGSFGVNSVSQSFALVLFSIICFLFNVVAQGYRAAREKAAEAERRLLLRESEESLRQQRELLRVTLRSIGDAVLATDTSGRITFLNPVAERLTGWKEEEVLLQSYRNVFKIINEKTREEALDIVAQALACGDVVSLANFTTLVSKDGREVPIEDSAAAIKDSNGNIRGSVLVFRDVTEKRRAEENLQKSEQRVRLKLESILSPEGNLGNLELSDIIDVQAIQSMIDDFYAVAQFPISILDLKGNVLVGAGWQDICMKFHRVHPETCRFCKESDLELSKGILPGQCKLYKCKNNMWDIATPLLIGDQHVGNIFSGQFFFEGETLDYELFRNQARKYGFDEVEYLAALDGVSRLNKETVDAGMAFLMKFAHLISQMSYSNIKLARSVSERDALLTAVRESKENLIQQREWLRVTLNSIGDAVLAADINGKISLLNPVAAKLTGWGEEEAKGQPADKVFRIINERTGEKAENIIARVLAEGATFALANHTALITKSGEVIPIEDSAAPIKDVDGNVAGAVLVFYDVTERRKAQKALEEAIETAESANLAKTRFLANISHEIRTPLNAIVGFSELLKEDIKEKEQRNYVDIVMRNSKQLLSLIEDILDISKVEAEKLKIERTPVSLRAIMEDVKQMVGPQAESNKINLVIEELASLPSLVLCDETRLKQILTNVIGNAIKFTPESGSVSICSTYDDGRGQVSFCVKDTGVGVAPHDRERIFLPFHQAQNGSGRKFGGTGLGLTLSRKLARMLGGDVSLVDSSPGFGATFLVTIGAPIVKVGPQIDSRSTFHEKTLPLKGMRILVVDDTPDALFLVVRQLSKFGAEVESAEDGIEAIDKALAKHFDIVLMDIAMPNKGGLDATRELRERGYKKPIIALTANAFDEERNASLRAGCNAHLSKPIEVSILIAELKKYTSISSV